MLGPWAINAKNYFDRRRTRVRLRIRDHDGPVHLRRIDLENTFVTNTGSDWIISFPYRLGLKARRQELGDRRALMSDPEFAADLRGEDAMRAAANILPAINAQGARTRDIKSAVGLLEQTPHAPSLFMRFSPRTERWTERHVKFHVPDRQYLTKLDAPVRLALEMAANEENERRAMEGELAHLEMEWRDAEEIAQIADVMDTAAVSSQVDDLRSRSTR